MKAARWALMLLASMALPALAADSANRTSPQDANPACMDRKTDSSSANCVVPDDGKPRHRYPPAPKPAVGGATSAAATSGTTSTIRRSGAAK